MNLKVYTCKEWFQNNTEDKSQKHQDLIRTQKSWIPYGKTEIENSIDE